MSESQSSESMTVRRFWTFNDLTRTPPIVKGDIQSRHALSVRGEPVNEREQRVSLAEAPPLRGSEDE